MTVRDHEWWDPEALTSVGTIHPERVQELSEGRLRCAVDVRLNRTVVGRDVTFVIVGPVCPPRSRRVDHLVPADVDVDAMIANPDTLVVPDAGEILYRLR